MEGICHIWIQVDELLPSGGHLLVVLQDLFIPPGEEVVFQDCVQYVADVLSRQRAKVELIFWQIGQSDPTTACGCECEHLFDRERLVVRHREMSGAICGDPHDLAGRHVF